MRHYTDLPKLLYIEAAITGSTNTCQQTLANGRDTALGFDQHLSANATAFFHILLGLEDQLFGLLSSVI